MDTAATKARTIPGLSWGLGGAVWKRKARAFRILSALPFGDEIHYWLQRHVTRTLPISAQALDEHVLASERKLDAFRACGGGDPGRALFFEFGAGRDLAGPLALSYAGVGRVLAIDIAPIAKRDLVQHAAAHIAAVHGQPAPGLRDWQDLQTLLRLEYRAPADARATGLPDRSVDCVTSWHTLQHIPSAELAGILREARRILKPTGLSIMRVHYEDMYAGQDPSLSPFHYLTYTDEEWAPYDSRLQYQNRLRHGDVLRMFREAGFAIVRDEPQREPIDAEIASRLAPRFRGMDLADVFTSKGFIVARPA